MKKWTKYGKRYLGEAMAGTAGPITHMYLEYGDDPVSLGAERDKEYFANMQTSKRTGYKRIPLHSVVVDDDGVVTFTAMLKPGDIDAKQRVTIQCATLASSSGASAFDDKFVFLTTFDNQQYIPGSYMVVIAMLKLETNE
jgi:hypothetical protein